MWTDHNEWVTMYKKSHQLAIELTLDDIQSMLAIEEEPQT